MSKPDGEVIEFPLIERVRASILLVLRFFGRAEASAVRSISTGSVALVPRILSYSKVAIRRGNSFLNFFLAIIDKYMAINDKSQRTIA